MIDAYADKNTYDIIFNNFRQAKTVLKRVRSHYIKDINELINREEASNTILTDNSEYIIKPSDTNNGIGINKLRIEKNSMMLGNNKVILEDLENKYGHNFLIQEVIKQHSVMSKPHPSSVNTLRMVTLRWEQEIINIYTFARFGVNNDVKDNAGSGGLSVGVQKSGKFMDYGIQDNQKVLTHPTTNMKISDFGMIPNYDTFLTFAKDLHKEIIHHDYISWDIAVGEDGQPILVEANFFGSCFLNQIALASPTFHDLTTEILQDASKSKTLLKKKNIKTRATNKLNRSIQSLKKENRSYSKSHKSLNYKIKALNQSQSTLKKEIQRIKSSRSWRYTRVLRRKKK